MSDWLSLPEVVSTPRLAERRVAWRNGKLVERERFLADVHAWRAAFADTRGQRVALYFEDCYEFVTALYGAWHAGKTAYLPGDTRATTLDNLLPQVDATAGAMPHALRPKADGPGSWVPRPLDPLSTELVVYTSGSTGEPLAIRKRLRQLDAEVRTLEREFGPQAGDASVFSTVSHQHIYGLLFHALWPLGAGRPIVAQRLTYPEEMSTMLGEMACVLVSSPAHLKRLPDSIDWSAARRCLRAVFSSGGPLSADASQATLEQLGESPVEVYGSSETGGIAWRQRATHGERWQLFPDIDVRIDDELLSVRSPYLRDDDWWQTSDRVRALPPEDGGGFVLLGRADRIAKIEEKRVSLTAIERDLLACPEIAQAKVLVLDRSGAQRLAVVAVPSEAGWEFLERHGKPALNERLRGLLLQSVERIALPRSWRYVRAIPMDAHGKTTEAMLAALFRPSMPEVRWMQRESGVARAVLDVLPELAVFDGHFPGVPILPGVAQLHWAAELAEECFAPSGEFRRCEALKFQRPVLPGMQLQLDLKWSQTGGVLEFRYSSEAGVHASGRMVFGA